MRFSKIQIDPLTYSAFCQGEQRGRIQFTALHRLLKAKNVAELSLINMDLACTNCYHSVLESPSLNSDVKMIMCVDSGTWATHWKIAGRSDYEFWDYFRTFSHTSPRAPGKFFFCFFLLQLVGATRPCQKCWITDRQAAQTTSCDNFHCPSLRELLFLFPVAHKHNK